MKGKGNGRGKGRAGRSWVIGALVLVGSGCSTPPKYVPPGSGTGEMGVRLGPDGGAVDAPAASTQGGAVPSGAQDGATNARGTGDGNNGNVVAGAQGSGGCIAGSSCDPANPCHVGQTVCGPNGGPASCQDTGMAQANGTDCGAGSACRDGTCQACAAGTACPVLLKPCRSGTILCATGAPVCTELDNLPNGTSCGSGSVCQEGVCAACMNGAPCTPTNPCHIGTLSCTAGAPMCVDGGSNAPAGAVCGAGMVCSAVGVCGACMVGASCTVPGNPCRVGVTACNTGSPVCVESGNAPNGTDCSAGMVCSGGACTSCTAGLDCVPTNACHTGKTACAPAVSCTDAGGVVPNGMGCGTDKVCSNGTCGSCKAGQACQSATPCKVGTTSCATGVSVCTDTASQPDGTMCGSGKVCFGGTCVACSAGTSCVPSNPCHMGTQSCSASGAVCNDAMTSLSDGAPCGANLVCRSGMCVSCQAGSVCQPPTNLCKNGTTTCTTGTSVCMETTNKPAGNNCGNNMVCTSAGTCTACVSGQSCPPANACHKGALTCTSGAPNCVDSNASLADGAPCGTNLVCKSGTCSTCAANMSCPPTNPCKTGTSSCSTGSLICNESGNKPAGSPCGTFGMYCNAGGTCTACGTGNCTPPSNPCHAGSYSCSTGTQVCVDTGSNLANGADCSSGGTSKVCNAGTCVACATGNCNPANLCKTGTNSCGTGAPVCMETGNKPLATPCGNNMVCNSSGVCTGCNPTSCTAAPCHTVSGSCSTGALVCTDMGMLGNGTSCGTGGMVCSAGACVSCASGGACSPDSTGCKNGAYSCSTGKQVCVSSGNKSSGTSCGSGQTCSGNTQTAAHVCDGNGQCPTPASISCNGNGCNTTTNTCNSCSTGFTLCGTGTSTCYDLMNDDKHCGGCSGTASVCQLNQHCKAGHCRFIDGSFGCSSDADCYTSPCGTYYPDYDHDGYPNPDTTTNTARYCGTPPSSSGYIPLRSDGLLDCCDGSADIHPGATQYFAWAAGDFPGDPECDQHASDTNCDGRVVVNPAQVNSIPAACQLDGSGTCQTVFQTVTNADCQKSFSTCGCDATCKFVCGPGLPITISCL
jgi:hypothetical protein